MRDRSSLTLSIYLVGVIVGEFIGAERGLGKLIIEAEATLETADMMVALFVLMVVGVALAIGIRRVQAWLLRRQAHYARTVWAGHACRASPAVGGGQHGVESRYRVLSARCVDLTSSPGMYGRGVPGGGGTRGIDD